MAKSLKKSACNEPGSHKDCPIFLALGLIANKWSVGILYHLMQAPKSTLRFGALQKQLSGITQRELTKHLREFEKTGIVGRTVYPEVPPRVEYTLSNMGHSLLTPIEALAKWAEKHGPAIQKKREEFDRKAAAKLRQ